MSTIRVIPATEFHVPAILELIRALAIYEKLAHEVVATESQVRESLFGVKPAAEVLLAYWGDECAGLAVFFATYSTFLAQPGLYLEDLYVKEHLRRRGIGVALLEQVARTAVARGCGRLEWGVLNWNQAAIAFYQKLGAVAMDDWTKYRLTGAALKTLGASG